jgi:hypothetical protein
LLAKTLHWKTGQGTKDRYSSIVDQPEKPLSSYHFFDSRCHLIHRIRISHIKDEWDILPTQLLCEAVRIGFCAHATKDAKSASDKRLASCQSDTTGCAGNDYVWHRAVNSFFVKVRSADKLLFSSGF